MKLRWDTGLTLAAIAFFATILYLWPEIVICCREAVQ